MLINRQIHSLEVARRRALWELADLQPGDVRAEQWLVELDEIDLAQGDCPMMSSRAWSR